MHKAIGRDRFSQKARGIERVMRTGLTGDNDHGNVARVRVRGDLLAHGFTAHDRQPEIQDDGGRRIRVEDAEGIEAVPRFEDVEAGECERSTEHASQVDVIFDDENGVHCCA